MIVEIDQKSGFCFGVRKAISLAEKELAEKGKLFCLGDIVHNDAEVRRLAEQGLISINKEEFKKLRNCKVLIRAHGEPPETYLIAKENNIELIEGTCPVVLKLQERIKKSQEELGEDSQMIIFGKAEHPEVIGLNGQLNNKGKIVLNAADLESVDFTKPISLYAQTTMNKEKYWELKAELEDRAKSPELLDVHDTICGQVANRAPKIEDFSKAYDAIVFAGGKKSSNSKVLFSHCKKANKNSFFVSEASEVSTLPLKGFKRVGVCGATSTPLWLMEQVAGEIQNNFGA